MPKKPKKKIPSPSKQALLDALDDLERMKPLHTTFKPGRGVSVVREAIRKLPENADPELLAIDLAKQLFAHEPWDELPHHLLEPLFDVTRLLGAFPQGSQLDNIPESNVAVRYGAVRVQGDLAIRGVLLVAGSLQVSGAILALGDEWHSGTLVVTGDVRAARASILGPTAIGGTLALKQGLITAYYHDTSSTLTARAIETPIWFDRGDIPRRVVGKKTIDHKLRFQPWIEKRLDKYFEGESIKVDWKDFNAGFFRLAIREAR